MSAVQNACEMTRDEFNSLKRELEILKTVKRDEVSEKIRVARGFGDLSENSEYDEAKNDQAHLEARIARLEEQLKNVCIVDHISTDVVAVGTKVTLLDIEFGEETQYRVVSSVGSSEDDNTITSTSPVGIAIIGKREGEEAIVHAPGGEVHFRIIKISK